MKKWLIIGVMSLIVSGVLTNLGGGRFLTLGLAQQSDPFLEETERLLVQYEALKAKSLALIETVRSLQEVRDRLLAKEKASKEALDRSDKARQELETQYHALLDSVKNLPAGQGSAMTEQTMDQETSTAMGRRLEALQRRQAKLESELKESQEAYRTEKAKVKETSKNLKKVQKALEASEKDNIELQLDVVEMNSLSRESRIAFHYDLGRLYTRHGEYDAAIAEFQETLELEPNFAESYLWLGKIYRESLGRADLASHYFRRYVALRPRGGNSEQIKGWLTQTQREMDTKRETGKWGAGFFQNLRRIFF